MSFYPKGFLVLGLLVFAIGGGLFLVRETPLDASPPLLKKAKSEPTMSLPPFPNLVSLAGPWYQMPPPRPVAVVVPPAPVKAPEPVDKKSVVFVGLYHEKDGTSAYFFKYLPSGKVMILKPGQPTKGWELTDLQPHLYSLTGPGGHYEVSY